MVTRLGEGFCSYVIHMFSFQGESGAPGETGADGIAGEEVRGMGLSRVQCVVISVISNAKG